MKNENWGGLRDNAGPKPQGDEPKAKYAVTVDAKLVEFARREARRLGLLHRGEPNLSAYTEHLYREARKSSDAENEEES
ncbi:MAG: hypothetical protein EOP06_31075 [Proteobacteria bacterium]|nr:MAG: hypothetical protein EOP06_31075 [Pseudomonadota bacterium]